MLKVFYSLNQIDFGRLMDLYSEGNKENAAYFYPNEDSNIALMKAQQDFYSYLKDDFFQNDGAVYAIWEQYGNYISALRLEPYKDGLLLEALETHPQYRQQGHAKALVAAVLAHLKGENGCIVYSHVGKGNKASLQVHLACGFQRVSEQAAYIDGSVSHSACTMRICL